MMIRGDEKHGDAVVNRAMVSSRTTITTITRQCVAVCRSGRLERSRSSRNKRRPHTRTRACARPSSTFIYPFSFLLVSPRAVSCSAFHFFIFAHLKTVSPRGPLLSRAVLSFLPSLVTLLSSRFAKRKNDKRSSADTFETSWRINEVTGTFGQGFP